MEATIIPLVKNKSGDLTDASNYRAIAISTACSKILEFLMYDQLQGLISDDNHQFGFKKDHSTGLCTSVFKETVDYYRRNGSHVFACFVDFNKAFDNVDYWLLSYRLINTDCTHMQMLCIRLITYWYSHQAMHIRWQNVVSNSFKIFDGVRQGGVLSPFLFRFYVYNLIKSVANTNVGCNVGGMMINILCFADDMVLIAPSWRGMQYLITLLYNKALDISMTFNTRKTVCMIFNPYCKHKIVDTSFPKFCIGSIQLEYVAQCKYLGHIIDNNLNDDTDINREIRNMFTRCNILIRRFSKCSTDVKIILFRSYCICFYDSALWSRYCSNSIAKLLSCYNRCMKIFFGYEKFSSVTNMLLTLGLPSGSTVLHNQKISHGYRISTNANKLVQYVLHVTHA
jgi:hypothetical protein